MTSPAAGRHSSAYVIYEFERRAYPVSGAPVRIGRDASNDIVLRESAVSRFNSEIKRADERSVLESTGATPARVNGETVAGLLPLNEGDRIEIGSAILTYTEQRLPIGVSVIERAKKRPPTEDIANRRDTIKHPLFRTGETGELSDPNRRTKVLVAIAVVVLLLYFFGR